MSDFIVTEFSEPQQSCPPHDLLAHLYREIGISAVAAALDVMAAPQPGTLEKLEDHRIPAILKENLAA